MKTDQLFYMPQLRNSSGNASPASADSSETVASGLTPLKVRFREEFSKIKSQEVAVFQEGVADCIYEQCAPLINMSAGRITNFSVENKMGIPTVTIQLEKYRIKKIKIEYKTAKMQHGVYTGTFVNGKYHGQGRCEFVNGDTYKGEFKGGYFHGQGICEFVNGSTYKGAWKDGKRHGKGRYELPNGDSYEGGYKDGKRHGQGKETYTNGTIYEGGFKDGKRHGQGKETYTNGTTYEGGFKDGKRHGQGKVTYTNGMLARSGMA